MITKGESLWILEKNREKGHERKIILAWLWSGIEIMSTKEEDDSHKPQEINCENKQKAFDLVIQILIKRTDMKAEVLCSGL